MTLGWTHYNHLEGHSRFKMPTLNCVCAKRSRPLRKRVPTSNCLSASLGPLPLRAVPNELLHLSDLMHSEFGCWTRPNNQLHFQHRQFQAEHFSETDIFQSPIQEFFYLPLITPKSWAYPPDQAVPLLLPTPEAHHPPSYESTP